MPPRYLALMCTLNSRYLVRKDGAFICATDAHKVVASTCLTYLCFRCFDELEHTDIESFIQLGEYVLQGYACKYWLYHVENTVVDTADGLQDFVELLQNFLKLRSNPTYSNDGYRGIQPLIKLRALQSKWPEVCASLKKIAAFAYRTRDNLEEFGNYLALSPHMGSMYLINVVANDTNPFKLEAALYQIQDCFEALAQSLCNTSVHPNSRCSDLHTFYGGLFRCPKYTCIHFHTGFDTLGARDKHGLKHERMFKCTVEQCDFRFLGFQSESELKEHLSMHSNQMKQFDIGTSFQARDSDFCKKALNLAAQAGDIALVRDMSTMCKDKKNVSFWQELFNSAASSGSEELVLYLLDLAIRCDMYNAKLGLREHVWYLAATNGLEGIVAQLVEMERYPNGDRQKCPLHAAVAQGSETIVMMFLESGANIESFGTVGNRYNEGNRYPLHTSIVSKNKSMVRLLLSKGANVNSIISSRVSQYCDSALHLAARLGLFDVAETLLDYGALINVIGSKEERPVDVASRKGFKTLVQLLTSRGALLVHEGRSFSTLHSAVREVGASKEVITFLMEKGLELDGKTDDGETPLHWAARYSSEKVVEYLLLMGAEPNMRSNNGLTPLHATVANGTHILTSGTKALNARTLNIIQLLAEKADDEAKHNALWVATNTRLLCFEPETRKHFCRAFISIGADPLTRYTDGKTLLFAGCRAFTGERAHMKFLLSLGVSAKAVDAHGNSILHHLASAFSWKTITESDRRSFKVILEDLIAAGANLRGVNNNSEVAGDALRAIGFDFPDVQD